MFRLLCVFAAISTATQIQAGPFRWRKSAPAPVSNQTQQVGGDFSHAQGVANYMARISRIGHFGGNRGYEGVGMGPTPQAAEWNCCYRRSMIPREIGIAQGANGMWYACCRY